MQLPGCRVSFPQQSQSFMPTEFQLLIIGSGSAGSRAAITAAREGVRVAVVEQNQLGGTCLHSGCIPVKSLMLNLGHAPQAVAAVSGDQELAQNTLIAHWMTRQRRAIAKLTEQLDDRYDEMGVQLLRGQARFIGSNEVEVVKADNVQTVRAEKIILATGGRPQLPPGYSTSDLVNTSDRFINLSTMPQRLAIIGGGHIGCEFASIYAGAGAEVTLFERTDSLLPDFARDAGQILERHFRDLGIRVIRNEIMPAENIEEHEDFVRLHPAEGGPVEVDCVLVATGRVANLEGLQLDRAGIEVSDEHYVVTNEYLETTNPNVYAAGDVNGILRMAHAAAAQAQAAARNALGAKETLNYHTLPVCVWTHPEIAIVGMSGEAAQAQGLPVRSGRTHFVDTVRSIALEEVTGFVELTCHGDTGEVLGAMIVGHQAGELISHIALGMELGANARHFARMTYPHPTYSEAIAKAARAALGKG